ncbi:hypothetical protein D5086_004961 [Populus alba]|uniref:Uncharacterized protein n=1 Tax=Populus alba TaxID=43335 RepID=A0ACC4CSC4_POPAL
MEQLQEANGAVGLAESTRSGLGPRIEVDGKDKNKQKKGGGGFQVGKRKVKTKLSALAKAKADQAMQLD